MAECSVSDSFIVRVYRFDTEDSHKLVGLVETTDGLGVREAFKDTDELGAILNGHMTRHRKGRRKNNGTILR